MCLQPNSFPGSRGREEKRTWERGCTCSISILGNDILHNYSWNIRHKDLHDVNNFGESIVSDAITGVVSAICDSVTVLLEHSPEL